MRDKPLVGHSYFAGTIIRTDGHIGRHIAVLFKCAHCGYGIGRTRFSHLKAPNFKKYQTKSCGCLKRKRFDDYHRAKTDDMHPTLVRSIFDSYCVKFAEETAETFGISVYVANYARQRWCRTLEALPAAHRHEVYAVCQTDDRSWTAATRNRVKAAASKTYKLGMDNSKVHTNPARFVPQKKENPGRLRFVSHDEEVLLRNAIMANRPHCIYQFDLALNTGMRKSEQFTVELGQADFEHEYIYLQMTKNGNERYVHLNRTALNTLGSLKEERDRRGLKFPTLFFDKQNSPIKDPREWFAVTCEEAGIEGVTWHILRHTYCSRLVMAGVDLKTAQELMGHKTLAMTARYAHLSQAISRPPSRSWTGYYLKAMPHDQAGVMGSLNEGPFFV